MKVTRMIPTGLESMGGLFQIVYRHPSHDM